VEIGNQGIEDAKPISGAKIKPGNSFVGDDCAMLEGNPFKGARACRSHGNDTMAARFSLLYLRRSIETRKDTADFSTIANTTDVLSEIIVQVAIIDAAGIMRASNVGPQPAPPLDLSDRDHYKVHVSSGADRLFISKPVIGRASGRWSVQFSRRFLNADRTFAGVVVASLDPEHLTKFYDKIDFGALLHTGDGISLAYRAGAELIVDEHVGKFLAWQASVELIGIVDALRHKLKSERAEFIRERADRVPGLTAEQREQVESLIDELLEKMLLDPARRLQGEKDLRRKIQQVEAIRELFLPDRERP
jgi:hypothetical protein